MGIYLNPGNESFQRALRSRIYIDKTELISYTNGVLGTEQCNICVSRPRRFGKSMAANMLVAYYSKGCNSEEMFRELKIAKDSSFIPNLNKYDVIYLNISQFLFGQGGVDCLVDNLQKLVLKEVREEYGEFFPDKEESLPSALADIYSKGQAQKGFVFIIDEWDCIFREARHNATVQKDYLDFFRNLLKDRPYVQLAYMTGILPIKKYGTHSALNIFKEFSMTNPRGLATYVGFTENEVRGLCKRFDMKFSEAKRWYDGYRFKKAAHIYNPKSIVDAMMEGEYTNYWTSTETYEALQVYIDMNMDGLKEAIVSMLGGGICEIDTEAFQNDMTSMKSRDDVLTLLVHLGYLAYDERKRSVFIPNEEVRREFIRAIKNGGRPELAKAIQASDRLLQATLQMNAVEVGRLIDEAHSANTSPDFYNNEQSLRSVIALAYYSSKDDYLMIHELPGGIGYSDIVFLPRKTSGKPAMVVELKWDKSAEGAIAQIKAKKYVQAIENYGGDILLVGINYDKSSKKHECVIEKYKKA